MKRKSVGSLSTSHKKTDCFQDTQPVGMCYLKQFFDIKYIVPIHYLYTSAEEGGGEEEHG